MDTLLVASFILFIASFSSCQNIRGEVVTGAVTSCAPYGGLKVLRADVVFSMEEYEATCNNGVKIPQTQKEKP